MARIGWNHVQSLSFASKFTSSSTLVGLRRCSVAVKRKIKDGPGLVHFIQNANKRRTPKIFPSVADTHAYISPEQIAGNGRKVMLVTYGCQMNENDMDVVRSMLIGVGYEETSDLNEANVILLMTCSIREGAEEKVWKELRKLKRKTRKTTVAVLGCMAERLRENLLQTDLCHVVAGPDSYRDLPRLLAIAHSGSSSLNVQLSLDETYADVIPVRKDPSGTSAFVSIMRGCDNMCTYCIVPFTRGRERSRPIDSIINELKILSDQGVKEVTLLGQNVNSYRDMSESSISFGPTSSTVEGFTTVYGSRTGGRSFATLLDHASLVDPEMRIRFTSPHPKDFPLEVIQIIRDRANICNQIHLPAQSGDDEVLSSMGRGYTRDSYLRLVSDIRSIIPTVSITSDFIAGFCGETEEAHQRTLSLIREVEYSFCFVFPYSMRQGTRAHRRFTDDVSEETKKRRHLELAETFREVTLRRNEKSIGREELVLVEGPSKRSKEEVVGRTEGGTALILPNINNSILPRQYVVAQVTSATSQTLRGEYRRHSSIAQFTLGR